MRSRICLEDLSHGGGSAPDLAERARALGCDLDQPHVVLQAATRAGHLAGALGVAAESSRPPSPGRSPARCSTAATQALRGLVGCAAATGAAREAAGDPRGGRHGTRWRSDVSDPCEGRGETFADRLRGGRPRGRRGGPGQRRHPASSASTTWAPYKYLLRVAAGRTRPRPPRRGAAAAGRVRPPPPGPSCLLTLEEYPAPAGEHRGRPRRRSTCTRTPCGSGCAKSTI